MTPAWEKPLKMLSELDLNVKIKALRELGRLKAVECQTDIIKLLNIQDPKLDDVKLEAIITLGKIADPSIGDQLLTYMDTTDIPFLMELITTLGILGANGFTKAAPAIEKKLDHANFRIRKFSIQALAKCGNASTIEKLFEIFQRKETTTETKELLAETIGQIGGSRAIEILKDLVKEGLMEIRRAAIKALGEARTQISLEVLGQIYNDKKEDKIIRKFAEDAIRKIIEGARDYYLQVKQRAEDILHGKE